MVIENGLLASLPTMVLQALERETLVVRFDRLSVLCEPGDQLTRAYFPHDVIICKGILDGAGRMAAPTIIGFNGMIGAFAALDGARQHTKAFVQAGGTVSAIAIDTLRSLACEYSEIGCMLQSYCRYLYNLAQRAASCNASHSSTQRLCAFLIQLQTLARRRIVEVTQGELAEWLAVRRTSVCLIVHHMKERGLISIRRGKIEINDPVAVSRISCGCYRYMIARS
jgi:CRP-like cAMP-binding protein